MPAEAMIITGERTAFEYLIQPIRGTMSFGMWHAGPLRLGLRPGSRISPYGDLPTYPVTCRNTDGSISSFVSAVPGNMATGIDPAHSERAS